MVKRVKQSNLTAQFKMYNIWIMIDSRNRFQARIPVDNPDPGEDHERCAHGHQGDSGRKGKSPIRRNTPVVICQLPQQADEA